MRGFNVALQGFASVPLNDQERAFAWGCAVQWAATAVEDYKASEAANAFALLPTFVLRGLGRHTAGAHLDMVNHGNVSDGLLQQNNGPQ